MNAKQNRIVLSFLTFGFFIAIYGVGALMTGETGWWAWGPLVAGVSLFGNGLRLDETYSWGNEL